MIGSEVHHKVLLPRWIWEEAQNKEDLKKLILQYMERYPDYVVKSVKNGFAICDRE